VGVLVGRTLGLQLLTAGVTVVLARLLTPSDYGLFAIALAVQRVGQRAAEFGLPAALIRMDEKPPRSLQAAVAGVLLVTSSSLAALMLLAAFGVAPAFGGSRTLEVIAVSGCAIPLYAARAIPMVMMERELRFGRVAIVETADTLAFNCFALLGAIAGLGAFSLAGAVPAGGLAGALTAWAIQPFARRPSLDLGPVKPLASFGLKVSALQGIYLLQEVGFVSIIAAIGGTSVAGFYAMAKRLFSFPIALTSAVGRVSFPALSRQPELRAMRAAKIAAYTAIAAGLPLALVAGAIQPLISVVLGDEWLPTTDIVLIGSLGMMLTASANATMVGFALAEGKAGGALVAAVVETAIAFAMAVALTASMGEAGIGLTLTVSMLAASVAFAASTDAIIRRSLFGVSKACAIAVAAAGVTQLLGFSEDVTGLILSLAVTSAIWLVLELIFSRAEIVKVVRLAKPILRPTAAA
jgi:lipopolysaccharide exporter